MADRRKTKSAKIRFKSNILPPYLRRTKSIDELLPWLYLKGISTGDFSEALAALLGMRSPVWWLIETFRKNVYESHT